jgi:hypothetical protein
MGGNLAYEAVTTVTGSKVRAICSCPCTCSGLIGRQLTAERHENPQLKEQFEARVMRQVERTGSPPVLARRALAGARWVSSAIERCE